MEIEDALEYYEINLYNKNLSDSTINLYKKELNKFCTFLKENRVELMDEIKPIHIEKYLSILIKIKNGAKTRRRKKSIIDGFFKYCVSRELVKKDLSQAIDPVKVTDADSKKRDTLTEKEVEKLIKSIEKNSVNKKKNIIMIKFFVYCGVRVSELVNIKISNIDWKNKFVTIQGKGRKNRVIPLYSDLEKDIKEYMKNRKVNSDYIFTSKNHDKPMTTRSAHASIKRHIEKAGINKNIGCHSLRRTSATNYLRAGVNMRYIQILLGHSDISTTTIYLDPNDQEVLNSLQEANKKMKK